jgi:hypothetical protein
LVVLLSLAIFKAVSVSHKESQLQLTAAELVRTPAGVNFLNAVVKQRTTTSVQVVII